MKSSAAMRYAFAVILLCATVDAGAQVCVSATALVSQRAVFPNRYAGPIAWNGSALGVAKTETGPANSLWFVLHDEEFNLLRNDVKVADSSLDGPFRLIWTGLDFGLFYFTPERNLMMRRIGGDGEPIGPVIPVTPNHNTFAEDEFDVIWDRTRGAYLVLRTITQGFERGMWLSMLNPDGSVRFDRLVYFFVAAPALPRLAVADNGTIGIFFEHATVPGTSFMRFDVNDRFQAPVPISSRHSLQLVVAARGNTFGVAKQTEAAGGTTEVRFLTVDTNATTVLSERTLVAPRGIDVAPVALLPVNNEWALSYNDSVLGFRELRGEYRLRRFTPAGATLSDTQFSPDPLRSTFLTPFPFVWTGRSYMTAVSLFISRNDGTDSYLIRHCPLAATASADRPLARVLEPITFNAAASGGTQPYRFEWHFGDRDQIEVGPTRIHSYDRPGTYTVTLTTTDQAGAVSITTVQVRVVVGKTRAVR